MLNPNFRWTDLSHSLHSSSVWITDQLGFGRYVSETKAIELRNAGVTHILNVSEAPSLESTRSAGFRKVEDIPIEDLRQLPPTTALRCITSLNEMFQAPTAKVYLHCIAGQNRSPTIAWLYLIACGFDEDAAARLIEEKSPDAVPGHTGLINVPLIKLVRAYGQQNDFSIKVPAIVR